MTPHEKAMKRFIEDVKEYESYDDWNHADVAQMTVDEYHRLQAEWAKPDFFERLEEAALYIVLMSTYLRTYDQ